MSNQEKQQQLDMLSSGNHFTTTCTAKNISRNMAIRIALTESKKKNKK